MAYINVAEWSPDQVTDWLKGLDKSMYKYVNSFANNEIKGQTLLNIRPYELNELGITSIGHQEIVLEAVEHLRNFHYNLEKENLQFLALRVATTTKNLHHQLAHHPDSKVETEVLNDVTRAIATIKPLVGWLDRSPFQGQKNFNEIRERILKLGIEMATSAQRDRFVQNPVDSIRLTAEKLSKLADYIIQDISDPIILQPATLNLVTLKKRESELGFNIIPNYHGIHVITDIKYNSPAHISGKIEDGDEIIQINYQTIVGWHYKRVLQQLQESPPDILLTLKKRPRHTKIYGQIYMKPYRLPSKKRSLPYRFEENLPSPRIELIPPRNFPVLLPSTEKVQLSDSDSSSSSSISIPAESIKHTENDLRLYLTKPRAVLQRRNTICGDQASGFHGNITFWHEMTRRRNIDSNSLRDKSVSVGDGLDSTKRPITCIGIQHKEKYGDLGGALKGSLPDMKNTKQDVKTTMAKPLQNDIKDNRVHESVDDTSDCKNNDCKAKVVKFNPAHDVIEHTNATNVDIVHNNKDEINEIGGLNNEKLDKLNEHLNAKNVPSLPIKQKQIYTMNSTSLTEAINDTLIKSKNERTKDSVQSNNDEDKPPEIGPRNGFLTNIAPKPPPRPSKAAELVQRKFDLLKQDRTIPNSLDSIPISPIELMSNSPATSETKTPEITTSSPLLQHTFKPDESNKSLHTPQRIYSKYNNSDVGGEETELLTPNRTKTLTLKKKNSILAKRRKICLKTLELSDIQGHLFRRTKDKHGVTYWAKLYFVLVESALYGFRNKNSPKANCLIFLPGFTISLAKEVHSKPFAYKVYHPKKTFYFAAESEQALSQWMDYIKRATLKGSATTIDPMLIDRMDTRDIFSETDSSEDESQSTNDDTPPLFKHSFLGGGKSSKKRGSIDDTSSAHQQKSEKYHLGFGSLKKFTNLPFSSNKSEKERDERKKSQSDIPVPTAHFRSYRKIPGNAGMQLGHSNAMAPMDFSMMTQRNQTLNSIHPNPPIISLPVINDSMPSNEFGLKINSPTIQSNATSIIQQECSAIPSVSPPSISTTIIEQASSSSITEMTTSTTALAAPSTPAKPNKMLTESKMSTTSQTKSFESHCANKPLSKLSRNKTFNYIHASNPNLVEFTFQTSKTLDVGLPKVNVSNTFDQHQNLQGSITLKDLMMQREEDEAHNNYNNRVNLGVEKPNDRHSKRKPRRPNEVSFNETNRQNDDTENTHPVNKIQQRSLPKTPDYAQSFKTDDTEIIMARSKEGQKLRDFGYELISGDDVNNGNASSNLNNNNGYGGHHNSSTSITSPNALKPAVLAKPNDRFMLSTKRKGLNWIGLNLDSKRNDEEKAISKGSFKLNKPKYGETVEASRKMDERITNEMFHNASSTGNARGNDFGNFPFTNGDRKGSAPNSASYLSKLTFSTTKTAKEKRLLGSPRLHRAASSIFGRKNVENSTTDHSIFTQIDTFPNKYSSNNEYAASNVSSTSNHCFFPMPTNLNDTNISTTKATTPNDVGASNFIPTLSTSLPNSTDPNIEYPPVFVPETYSLRDPNVTH